MEIKQIELFTKDKAERSNFNRVLNQTLETINNPVVLPNNRLMQLEGECKIKSFRALKIAWVKAILLIIPLVASVIGLFLLKYFKRLRVSAFYSECPDDEADYFFIQSIDEHQEIETVQRSQQNIFVIFKNLKYKLVGLKLCPVGYEYEDVYESIRSKDYLERGVNQSTLPAKAATYGLNEHKVQVPNYFQYLFQVLTKPFFILQYAVCAMLILQRVNLFAYLYFSFSFGTTTINYILLYISFLKIKQIAEKQYNVKVIRNGKETEVLSHSLVPGDVVIPQKDEEMTFDGILMDGEVFVNEASLTGQSIPIGKFPAQDIQSTKKENTWLFEGSKVLESRTSSRVVVVNTGYATRRGRIIRKILTRNPKPSDVFSKAIQFLSINFTVGIIIYFATLYLMVDTIIPTFVGFRFMDFINWCFPPAIPIYFNLAFSYSLIRLKYKEIYGTEPEKTTEAAHIRTFCFDKTGTLTQNEIEVYEITKFISEQDHSNITEKVEDPSNNLIFKLFAACHTVRQVAGSYLGDQVDLRMYLHSGYKMSVPTSGEVRFIVQNTKGDKVEVLRINQFESKFQNMSVLVRDTSDGKYYVFVKGAPERIDRNSVFKFRQFEHLVASFSLGGYRTIGYAYKEISKDSLKTYLQGDREVFENGVTALGLVAFENKLKGDTRQTIDRLIESDIEPKMITGDNIFIAVETGYRAGIVKADEKVLLLEGRKQENDGSTSRIFKGITIEKQGDELIKKSVQLKEDGDYLSQQNYAIAIDNDFLTMIPEPVLTRQIKLFARISPENKAKIVKRFIQQENKQFESRSTKDRICGPTRWKVGMCGDGANDLMAIRQADIGIGISESDASYGSSFNVSKMLDVEHIIRESKNTAQSVVDLVIYWTSVYFVRAMASILLVSDVSNFGPLAMIFLNFAHSLFLVSFLSMSSPCDQPTKKRPDTNMLSFRNQLMYWTVVILMNAGMVGGYFYFTSSPNFIANTKRVVTFEQGYIGIFCQTQAILFVLINIIYSANGVVCYTSYPFRKKIYTNIPLFVTIVGNFIAGVFFFFYTDKFPKLFYFVDLPKFEAGISLLIDCLFIIAALVLVETFRRKVGVT